MRGRTANGAMRQAGTRRSPVSLMTALLLALGAVPSGDGGAAAAPSVPPPPLQITPQAVDLGQLSQESRGSFRLGFVNRTSEAIRLTYLYAECDCSFEMPDRAEVPAAGKIVLDVEYDMTDAEPGRWDEKITILTDHDRLPEITVPITAWVQGWGEPGGNRPDGG